MGFLFCVILTFSLPLAISAYDEECDVSQGERWLGGSQQSDFAACKKACEGTPRCQSVTFYDSSGSCSLFSTDDIQPSGTRTSGFITPATLSGVEGKLAGVAGDDLKGDVRRDVAFGLADDRENRTWGWPASPLCPASGVDDL